MARLADGSVVLDRTAPGRGAWLCRDALTGEVRAGCLHAAVSRGGLSRAFRAAVIPPTWEQRGPIPQGRENMEVGAGPTGRPSSTGNLSSTNSETASGRNERRRD